MSQVKILFIKNDQNFQIKPPDVDSGSEAAKTWVKRFEKLMLILAYILTFAIVLVCAVASKGVTLFIISQAREKTL